MSTTPSATRRQAETVQMDTRKSVDNQALQVPTEDFLSGFIHGNSCADMDPNALTQSPLSALTFVAAPALLTNAASVLALGTINRMLRTRDRMHELFLESKEPGQTAEERTRLVQVTDRVEKQAGYLLEALHSIYFALAAFASATLVTLLGAAVSILLDGLWVHVMALLGLLLGFLGAGGLVVGCVGLFRATRLSLANIREEAALIRARSSTV